MQELSGRAAIVTGGASGIGRATVDRLVDAGASVVIADLDQAGAEQAAKEVKSRGGEAVAVRVDVTSADDAQAMVAVAESSFGRLDVLSCNAGWAHYPKKAVELDLSDFDRAYQVNVRGVWLSARAAAPLMTRTGGGSIIVTGSVMGERARPGFAAYASSKAAANHLARTLALEFAPDGIRVNAVAPVATDTPMLSQFLGLDDPEGARDRFVAGIPLGRLADPMDIASATAFLASDAAAFITGVVLPVDGGRSI
ncbi:MAG: SDR family oxidoreductase [Actinomycetota bacterium]|nr:SDR family oxidoreductase [Actinomycetota bacterium]